MYIVLGTLLVIVGGSAFFHGLYTYDKRRRILLIVGGIVSIALAVCCAVIDVRDSMSTIQSAAQKQGLSVHVRPDMQAETLSPCSITLEYQNGQFVLLGADIIVTPESLARICDAKKQ